MDERDGLVVASEQWLAPLRFLQGARLKPYVRVLTTLQVDAEQRHVHRIGPGRHPSGVLWVKKQRQGELVGDYPEGRQLAL